MLGDNVDFGFLLSSFMLGAVVQPDLLISEESKR